jgi:hypothetical protein
MHQLIEPSDACNRVGHRTNTRLKQPGPGEYTYCTHCSLGYELAMSTFSHLPYEVAVERADQFVNDLRRRA